MFLKLIEATSLRLLDFVDGFTSPAELPEARDAWRVLEAQRRVAYELPWSHAVLRVLELTAYKQAKEHRDDFIATRLQIPLDEVQRCLRALAESQLIVRRKGRWIATQVLAVDTRRNPAAGRALKHHWASVGLSRFRARAARGTLFCTTCSPSRERYRASRSAHRLYQERGADEQSTPADASQW